MPKEVNERIIDQPYVRLRGTNGNGGSGGTVVSGSSSLAGLTDVQLTGLANGNSLFYNGTLGKWVNLAPGPGGGAAYSAGAGIAIDGLNFISVNRDAAGAIHIGGTGGLIVATGAGLTRSGNAVVVNLDATPGLEFTGLQLRVKAGHGIERDGTGMKVKPKTVSGLELDSSGLAIAPSVAGAGLDWNDSSKSASVNIGNGLEYVGDSIAVNLKGQSALHLDGTGISVDGVIAGAGLAWDDTFKIMSVNVGNGLMWDGDYAAVNENYAFDWTNVHKWADTLLVINPFTYSLAVDTNLIYADTFNNRVGINQVPGNAALDITVSALADHSQRLKRAARPDWPVVARRGYGRQRADCFGQPGQFAERQARLCQRANRLANRAKRHRRI